MFIVHKADWKKNILLEWMETNSLYKDTYLLTYLISNTVDMGWKK